MTCRTFTHHVGGAIRVECVAHPRWHEDAVKTGEHSARAVAHAIAAEHEAEDPSVESSSSSPSTGGSSARELHYSTCPRADDARRACRCFEQARP